MKKQSLFLLVFSLLAVLASQAQSTHSSILFKDHSTLTTPDLAMNSSFHPNIAQLNSSGMSAAGEVMMYASRNGRYEDAVHKRNVGIGLTAAGGALLVTGVALLAVGIVGFGNDVNGTGSGTATAPLGHSAEIAFGTILALGGTGMTIPGAIILAKGQRQMKKFKDSQSVN